MDKPFGGLRIRVRYREDTRNYSQASLDQDPRRLKDWTHEASDWEGASTTITSRCHCVAEPLAV